MALHNYKDMIYYNIWPIYCNKNVCKLDVNPQLHGHNLHFNIVCKSNHLKLILNKIVTRKCLLLPPWRKLNHTHLIKLLITRNCYRKYAKNN